MMASQILLDAEAKPALFCWWGPQPREAVATWGKHCGWRLPDELLNIWSERGGCDLFETETLLAPFGDSTTGDDIESVAKMHAGRGMPGTYFPFHLGMGISVFAMDTGDFLVVDDKTYVAKERFASFEDWYRGYLRPLFATRYGLGAESRRE